MRLLQQTLVKTAAAYYTVTATLSNSRVFKWNCKTRHEADELAVRVGANGFWITVSRNQRDLIRTSEILTISVLKRCPKRVKSNDTNEKQAEIARVAAALAADPRMRLNLEEAFELLMRLEIKEHESGGYPHYISASKFDDRALISLQNEEHLRMTTAFDELFAD